MVYWFLAHSAVSHIEAFVSSCDSAISYISSSLPRFVLKFALPNCMELLNKTLIIMFSEELLKEMSKKFKELGSNMGDTKNAYYAHIWTCGLAPHRPTPRWAGGGGTAEDGVQVTIFIFVFRIFSTFLQRDSGQIAQSRPFRISLSNVSAGGKEKNDSCNFCSSARRNR